MAIDGFEPYNPKDAELYNRRRWWLGLTWGDLLDRASDLYPGKEVLVDDTHRLTNAQLRDKVDRLAVGLMRSGVGSLDFVLLQLPNWHEFVISYFALQKIGAIVILLVARHGLAEINYLCSLTNPTAWILPEISYTKKSITNKAEFKRRLLTIKEQGYVIDNGEVFDGVTGIAAPIKDSTGSAVGGIGVSLITTAEGSDGVGKIIKELRDTTRLVSEQLKARRTTAGSRNV